MLAWSYGQDDSEVNNLSAAPDKRSRLEGEMPRGNEGGGKGVTWHEMPRSLTRL